MSTDRLCPGLKVVSRLWDGPFWAILGVASTQRAAIERASERFDIGISFVSALKQRL
jgi:hypothetical protein